MGKFMRESKFSLLFIDCFLLSTFGKSLDVYEDLCRDLSTILLFDACSKLVRMLLFACTLQVFF